MQSEHLPTEEIIIFLLRLVILQEACPDVATEMPARAGLSTQGSACSRWEDWFRSYSSSEDLGL